MRKGDIFLSYLFALARWVGVKRTAPWQPFSVLDPVSIKYCKNRFFLMKNKNLNFPSSFA
jgi:hypothetical protein